ncbi:MAG: hypothetical protein NC120_06720 [Ruminococcus sp.]|nr:hypothetical protein [Ruminococcus sp.]
MTIADYKNNSESDVEIIVKVLRNQFDCMGKFLYEGCLGDCPEELDGMTIDIVGHSLIAAQKGKTLIYLEHIA